MNFLLDKLAILLCCLPVAALFGWSGYLVASLLFAVLEICLFELVPPRWRIVLPIIYSIGTLFSPWLAVFLPLATCDFMRLKPVWQRWLWVAPVLFAYTTLPLACWVSLLAVCAASTLLITLTMRGMQDNERLSELRDQLTEMSRSLEQRSSTLKKAQDYEVHLATLNERSRIAREIHDNVGHLLTRAIMQVEALQVVHANDDVVKAEFSQVGQTLHTAMDTVRASVHDLHDESIDLRGNLQDALDGCAVETTHLAYHADAVPTATAYCLTAVVREALSNTVRHSNATTVDVDVAEFPGFYQLSVRDNGTKAPDGMAPGIGLHTMEDRVRALGGVFRTEFNNGFRVFVSIPKTADGSHNKGEYL